MTVDRLTENITSPVLLKNTTSFVKFGRSGTLISNLTKSPLVFPPCLPCEAPWRSMGLRGEFFFHSDALLALIRNGPEFIAREVQRWLADNHIKTIYIDPGSPWQNGFVESFHGRFRDECLNREQLWTRASPSLRWGWTNKDT